MDIYSLLQTKSHDARYLIRYTSFIEACKVQNEGLIKKSKKNPCGTYLEAHHILPKASDLFPEYESFKEHPWNKVMLTPIQHFGAHWLLWKCFGGSQQRAFWKMNHKQGPHQTSFKCSAKEYERLKHERSESMSQAFKDDPTLNENFKRRVAESRSSGKLKAAQMEWLGEQQRIAQQKDNRKQS